jgi:hypothetical protein
VSAYSADQERAVRVRHRVDDWRESALITGEQHDRMAADLETGLRRTNVFLRLTLFGFGLLIAVAATLFIAVLFELRNATMWGVATLAAGGCLAAAIVLVTKYQFYRFGIEEAFASATILFAGLAVGFLVDPYFSGDAGIGLGLAGAAVTALAVFSHFRFVYAAVIAMACAALAAFPMLEADLASRAIGVGILALAFVAARLARAGDGDDFPGDTYAVIETAAWGGIYLLLNLKASSWLSHPVEDGPVYWITYALIWIMPVAGLWNAVRERHRLLLDLNIILVIVTMMTNKPYLGAEQRPWDPITFGLLLVTVALGLRRWLDRGEGGARNGFVSYRVLASDRDRLSAAGSLSVLQPSLHPQHAAEQPKSGFGGGSSGGAGASGHF